MFLRPKIGAKSSLISKAALVRTTLVGFCLTINGKILKKRRLASPQAIILYVKDTNNFSGIDFFYLTPGPLLSDDIFSDGGIRKIS